ncbi:hypothetical protein [Natrinema salaciae]|nr:hypothetical protein [Natrinema salaciae]
MSTAPDFNDNKHNAEDDYAGYPVECGDCGSLIVVQWNAKLEEYHLVCKCAFGPAVPFDAEDEFYSEWERVETPWMRGGFDD